MAKSLRSHTLAQYSSVAASVLNRSQPTEHRSSTGAVAAKSRGWLGLINLFTMDTTNTILVYLRNLVRADVLIHKDHDHPVSFNGARTLGDFNSRLMIGEMMMTTFLADLIRRSKEEKELMFIVRDRLNRLSSLYLYKEREGWSHRHLIISRDKSPISYKSLPKEHREYIDNYLSIQRDSFEKQQSLFFKHESEGKDLYRICLSGTELVELALSIFSSKRFECLSGTPSRIGIVRFLAHCFGISFPPNYDTIVAQLHERNSCTLFLDFLRKSLIGYLREKKKK